MDSPPKAERIVCPSLWPITNSKLDLGTWQCIFYAEFDGQRPKRVIVKILGIE